MRRLQFIHHFGIFIAGLLILFIIAKITYHSSSDEERAGKAKKNKGPIEIAAVWSLDEGSNFFNGAHLAAEEINTKGGIHGRKILLHEYQEDPDTTGFEIAKEIARKTKIIASIGHFDTAWTNQAAVIYEDAGVLFLATNVTEPSFCEFGHDLLFRTLPDDREFARVLAAQAADYHVQRWAIFHVRDDYGYITANAIAAACQETGLKLIARRSYDGSVLDFRPVIGSALTRPYDGIILVDLAPRAGLFMKDLRALNVDLPVVGGHGLDDPMFLQIAGEAAEGLLIGSVFDPEAGNGSIDAFVKSYRDRYGSLPNIHAAQGYEAVSLIGQAVDRGGVSVPIDLSITLKHQGPWNSSYGQVSFTYKGAIQGKEIFLKTVEDGKFVVFPHE